MRARQNIIHERTNIIPIRQNMPTTKETTNAFNEYGLKQNLFDPTKSSPPNDFMIKLYMRMAIYNNESYLVTKEDSRNKE